MRGYYWIPVPEPQHQTASDIGDVMSVLGGSMELLRDHWDPRAVAPAEGAPAPGFWSPGNLWIRAPCSRRKQMQCPEASCQLRKKPEEAKGEEGEKRKECMKRKLKTESRHQKSCHPLVPKCSINASQCKAQGANHYETKLKDAVCATLKKLVSQGAADQKKWTKLVSLSGVDPKDIDVKVEGNILTITASQAEGHGPFGFSRIVMIHHHPIPDDVRLETVHVYAVPGGKLLITGTKFTEEEMRKREEETQKGSTKGAENQAAAPEKAGMTDDSEASRNKQIESQQQMSGLKGVVGDQEKWQRHIFLPGVDTKDINVKVEGDVLIVRAAQAADLGPFGFSRFVSVYHLPIPDDVRPETVHVYAAPGGKLLITGTRHTGEEASKQTDEIQKVSMEDPKKQTEAEPEKHDDLEATTNEGVESSGTDTDVPSFKTDVTDAIEKKHTDAGNSASPELKAEQQRNTGTGANEDTDEVKHFMIAPDNDPKPGLVDILSYVEDSSVGDAADVDAAVSTIATVSDDDEDNDDDNDSASDSLLVNLNDFVVIKNDSKEETDSQVDGKEDGDFSHDVKEEENDTQYGLGNAQDDGKRMTSSQIEVKSEDEAGIDASKDDKVSTGTNNPVVSQVNGPITDKHMFTQTFDLTGFEPNDISVKVIDNQLVISAVHEEQMGDYFSLNKFKKVVSLPADVDSEDIKSSLTMGGQLTIMASTGKKELSKEVEIDIAIAE